MKTRIMYFEFKGDGINGPARIGRLTFSKSGKSLYYQGRRFEVLKSGGYKTNYFDSETGEEVWISGCKKKGGDRLHPGLIEIEEDARRKEPQKDPLLWKIRRRIVESPMSPWRAAVLRDWRPAKTTCRRLYLCRHRQHRLILPRSPHNLHSNRQTLRRTPHRHHRRRIPQQIKPL